jgi:hypothetical protein
MTKYQIDFEGQVTEWGTITLDATDEEQAKDFALEQIKESYPEYTEVAIDKVLEL